MDSPLIQFDKNEIGLKKLNKRLDEEIYIHIENPIVLKCLKSRVNEVLSKYRLTPDVKVSFEIPARLLSEENQIKKCLRKAHAQYESEASKWRWELIAEIITLHKKICEIKAKYEEIKDIFD